MRREEEEEEEEGARGFIFGISLCAWWYDVINKK